MLFESLGRPPSLLYRILKGTAQILGATVAGIALAILIASVLWDSGGTSRWSSQAATPASATPTPGAAVRPVTGEQRRSVDNKPPVGPKAAETSDPIGIAEQLRLQIVKGLKNDEWPHDGLGILIVGGSTINGTPRLDQQWTVRSLENGVTNFNGRRLPAAVVRLEIPTINRSMGTYESICITYAAVFDKEFEGWRGSHYWACDGEDVGSTPSQWKEAISFEATR